MSFTASELVAATGGTLVGPAPPTIGALGIDSRAVTPGSAYVAIIGERHDGHDFCPHAVSAGATLLVVQRGRALPGVASLEVDDTRVALGQLSRAWRRRQPARLVGITGSTGKTSTKQLLAAALAGIGPTLATVGSLNNETGVPLTLLGLRPEHRFAVIEMGMRGLGQIAYLRGLAEPDVGLVLNAGSAHVGVVGSVERIAQGKSELWLGGGLAVAPADDPVLLGWAERRGVSAAQLLTYGPGGHVRVAACAPRGATGSDVTFEVALPGRAARRLEARVGLVGRHNADNAAAALAVCAALGVDLDLAAAGLAGATPAEHRASVLEVGGRYVIDDCYNANPTSMRGAVEMLVELAGSARAVACVGDMLELGDEGAAAHHALGRQLGERGVAQVVVLGAQASQVAAGLAAAGAPAPHVTSEPQVAARELAAATRPGDWILVKASRGMRLERVIAALKSELER